MTRFGASSPARPLRAALLSWFDAHARDLPWRRTRDPYAIWVSEIMLQQTRVETVIPYYLRFLDRFPTLRALAVADEDAVLAAWSGLGYYRRARLLHAGVRTVVAEHGGRVPTDADARRALPGIGRYTAGAIGSIAFGRPEPIVDGNVARVLARLDGIATPLGRADTERALWARAGDLVGSSRQGRPGALNQALMELGATVCTPSTPKCPDCPVSAHCIARRDGRVAELPVPRARKAPRHVALVAVVPWQSTDAAWLVRGDRALFGGLFAPPTAEGRGRAAARGALRRAGIEARLASTPAGELEHVLTHRRLHVEVWVARGARARRSATRQVVHVHGLRAVGVSRLTEKILVAAR